MKNREWRRASFLLGCMYLGGYGGPKQLTQKILSPIVKFDKLKIENIKSEDFEKGMGFYNLQKYEEARPHFQKAAEAGNLAAQYNLAQMYIRGLGGPKDLRLAESWLLKSAEKNRPMSQYSLGLLYMDMKDLKSAERWIRKAADAGLANAQNELGMMYLNGEEVPKDEALAIAWIKKSVAQNYAHGIINLKIIEDRKAKETK